MYQVMLSLIKKVCFFLGFLVFSLPCSFTAKCLRGNGGG